MVTLEQLQRAVAQARQATPMPTVMVDGVPCYQIDLDLQRLNEALQERARLHDSQQAAKNPAAIR